MKTTKSIILIISAFTISNITYAAYKDNPFAKGPKKEWFSDRSVPDINIVNDYKESDLEQNVVKDKNDEIIIIEPNVIKKNYDKKQIDVDDGYDINLDIKASDFKFTNNNSSNDIIYEFKKNRFNKCIERASETISIYKKAQTDIDEAIAILKKSYIWEKSSQSNKKQIYSRLRDINKAEISSSNIIINEYNKNMANLCNEMK